MRGRFPRIFSELTARVDGWAGDRIEAATAAHHRRRISRAGHLAQLDPPRDGRLWAAGDPPLRDGCALEVLVDGAEALPRIAEAIRGARSLVHVAGWHCTPDFGARRAARRRRAARAAGRRVAERVDVRVLLWAGAPLPVFPPGRARRPRRCATQLAAGTRHPRARSTRTSARCTATTRSSSIVDGEVAFVGGIDLTTSAATASTPRASGARRARLARRGVAAARPARRRRRRALPRRAGTRSPASSSPPAAAPGPRRRRPTVQLVRTVPEDVYDAAARAASSGSSRPTSRALRGARELIYLENQFLWSPEIVDILAEKLRDPPDARFRVVVLLPAKPNNGDDDTRGQLGRLVDADDGAGRFLAARSTPAHRRRDRPALRPRQDRRSSTTAG